MGQTQILPGNNSQVLPFSGPPPAQAATDVATKLPRERRRTLSLTQSLPVGVTIGEFRDGRGKPFYLRHGKGTERKLESFADEQDRNDAAAKLASDWHEEGSAVLSFDAREWRAYRSFRERCPASFAELEQLWHAARTARGIGLTVSEAVTRYLTLRLAEDIREDSDTHRHLKGHLVKRLCARFGELQLGSVSADLLRDWLAGLRHPKTGEPMSNLTKRHHRKDVNTFFKRAVLEGWCQGNPCAVVKPAKIDEEDVSVMPAADIFALLKANREEPVIGRIVFELFGGLRCSSVERLKAELVDVDARGIAMPGQVHKSGKRKYRQGHPDVLWQWIAHAAPRCWDEISAGNYDVRKGQAFIRAGVCNPGNVLRHSFASYLLAHTKNLPQVSYLMQHKDTRTTEKYEGVAREADARLVLAMTPAAVLMEWNKFCAHVAQSGEDFARKA